MQRYITFLRGINLGRRRIQMSRLKALFEELGYSDVSTFIASGNIVFRTPSADPGKLELTVQKHLQLSLGYEVETYIRTDTEVADLVAQHPFPGEPREGSTVQVAFIKKALAPVTAAQLAACSTQEDMFTASGREYYWLRRGRISDSDIWQSPALKALKLPPATMRNMTTIQKLASKYQLRG